MKHGVNALAALLFLCCLFSCKSQNAGFAMLLARIEQRPEKVTAGLLRTAVKRAKTSEDKLALLKLSTVLAEDGVLDSPASCIIARGFLQEHQTDEVAYCSVSILMDAGYMDEAITLLSSDYIEAIPEVYAELAEKNLVQVIKSKWLNANQFVYLADTLSIPQFHIYACILDLLEGRLESARLHCKEALALGCEVPLSMLWYTHLYNEILDKESEIVETIDLYFLIDSSFLLGKIDTMERICEKNQQISHRKYMLTMGYCNFERYLLSIIGKSTEPKAWTIDDQESQKLFIATENLIRQEALFYDDFNVCASYLSLLFYSGNYDAYKSYSANLPNNELFQKLILYQALWFESSSKTVAETLVASSKYPNNAEIQTTVLYILAKYGQWNDFERIYRKAIELDIGIHDDFLKLIYALLVIPKIETYLDISSDHSTDFFYTLNKIRVLELMGKESEALGRYENLLASLYSTVEKKIVLERLIALAKKIDNDERRIYYAVLLRDLERDSVLAITELANNYNGIYQGRN